MVSILITKDVFEASYKDLKFTVWNGNYFCTNLMKILLGGKNPASAQNSGAIITLVMDSVLLLIQLKIALALLGSHDLFLAPNKHVVF